MALEIFRCQIPQIKVLDSHSPQEKAAMHEIVYIKFQKVHGLPEVHR